MPAPYVQPRASDCALLYLHDPIPLCDQHLDVSVAGCAQEPRFGVRRAVVGKDPCPLSHCEHWATWMFEDDLFAVVERLDGRVFAVAFTHPRPDQEQQRLV